MSYKSSTIKTVVFFIALLLLFIAISLLTVSGFIHGELPVIGEEKSLWSAASDLTAATLGIAVAVSGAFVAIIIAQRTVDINLRSIQREAKEKAYLKVDKDIKLIKSLRGEVESIFFKSQNIYEIIENSDIINLVESSFSINNEADDKSLDKCKGINWVGTRNFLYYSHDGDKLRQSIHSLLLDISASLLDLSNCLDELTESDPIIASWNLKLNGFLKESKGNNNAKEVKRLIRLHSSDFTNDKALADSDVVELFQEISSTLRRNALKLKHRNQVSVDFRSTLLPLLEVFNNAYKYKLFNYEKIVERKDNVELILQSLDLLPVSIFIFDEYNEEQNKTKTLGTSLLALIYSMSKVTSEDDEKNIIGFMNLYTKNFEELDKSSIDTIYRLIEDRVPKNESEVGKVLNYYIYYFLDYIDPELLMYPNTTKSINKSILHQHHVEVTKNFRADVLSRAMDFFSTYPTMIFELPLSGDIFERSDTFEPLYLYWLNRDNSEFEGFRKAKNSLLYFCCDEEVRHGYTYSEKDIESIESLLAFIYNNYWNPEKELIIMDDFVVIARSHFCSYKEGERIPREQLNRLFC